MSDVRDFLEDHSFSGCHLKNVAAALFLKEITPTYIKRLSVVHTEIYDFVTKHMTNSSFNFFKHQHDRRHSWHRDELYPGLLYISLGLQNHDLYYYLLEPNIFSFTPERIEIFKECLRDECLEDPVGMGIPWSERGMNIPRSWPRITRRKCFVDLTRCFLKPSLWELQFFPINMTFPPGTITRHALSESPSCYPYYLDGQE